ncbi:type II toxin-antitoxin system Phd/YefM family antitoxin [Streptomyces coeruleorubidus]|uniref:type II toxin-antitoxin system Phd/YefM family antitoxin n=1 Tax=Streptomyces coeruleorubidus TaxID=116188 RepID=UPI0033C282F7
MQRMYRTREMQTKAKEILDAAEAGDDVRITRNGRVFRVVLVDGGPIEPEVQTSTDDLLTQLVAQSSQQTDLLRQLVEQKSTVLDDLIEQSASQVDQVADSGMVTAQVGEESVAPQWPKIVVPDSFPGHRPAQPGEPSRDELRAAQEYFGLRETPDGLEITEKGIQSALAHMKKASRDKPDSVEAQVIQMDPGSEERMECIRLYQLDRYSKALAKRADGDPKWLGVFTPPRF